MQRAQPAHRAEHYDPRRQRAAFACLEDRQQRRQIQRGGGAFAAFEISIHGNPFHAVAGPPYLSAGEIAVIRPKGRSGFEVIARIRANDWERLAH